MRNILRLLKFNLLWLFKYRRNIPSTVWFAGEDIEIGSAVYVANWRLHIVKACKADEVIKSKQRLITTSPIKAARPSYFAVRDASVWNLKVKNGEL